MFPQVCIAFYLLPRAHGVSVTVRKVCSTLLILRLALIFAVLHLLFRCVQISDSFRAALSTKQPISTLYIFFAQVIHMTCIIGSCASFQSQLLFFEYHMFLILYGHQHKAAGWNIFQGIFPLLSG